MPAKPQSTSKLTMTQQEIRAINGLISRDFAPRVFHAQGDKARQMPFTTQELRDIASHVSQQYSHSSASRAAQLLLLPVAPGRLHLFWQLGSIPAEMPPESPMSVHLFTQADGQQIAESEALELNLQGKHGHGELQLPAAEDQPAAGYLAVLGWLDRQQHFQPLLQSNSAQPAALPRTPAQHIASPAVEESLTALALVISSADSRSGQGKIAAYE